MENKSRVKIRVVAVDDSSFVRRALIRMFENHPDIQIVDVAADGAMAVDLVKRLQPDVVTLDVKMPVLDGLAALDRIMAECPTPVIMLSSLTEKGGENTLKSLELGAVDFVDKTTAGGTMDISALARELTAKIMTAARVDVRKLYRKGSVSPDVGSVPIPPRSAGGELVLIGTSTGGPQALQQILTSIPASFPAPILVVQHMPAGFTASLAERLNRICAVAVTEASDGEAIRPGHVYIAPAGKHLKIERRGPELHVKLELSPESALHRPSVDALFESAATIGGKSCRAFILTGMGKDGVLGAQAIKKAGGKVFVEAEETTIVYGMPKAVRDSVQVDGVIPLYGMANAIMKNV